MSEHTISLVATADVPVLLPLVASYCKFYEETEGISAASRADLEALANALIADPENQGIQLLARDSDGKATGFATVFWLWSTLSAGRVALMNDLYVLPDARGSGLAEQLIDACGEQAKQRGISSLSWSTSPSNKRAQAVYDRIGGKSSTWIDYELDL